MNRSTRLVVLIAACVTGFESVSLESARATQTSTAGSALERTVHEWEVKKQKMDLHLLSSMRRGGIDMWILMSREFHPDPVLALFGGAGVSGWYGHRNAYIFRDRGGDAPLETVILGTHQSGHMKQFFERIDSYGEEGLAPHLGDYVRSADPRRIAINRSRTVAMADGITAELLDYLEEAIGPEHASRLVSSEALLTDYATRRTRAELEIETEASWRTWNILRRAFSNEVVTPGETRSMEVWGWIVDEWKSQHLDFNFPPGITVYRRGQANGIDDSENPVIQPGDILHVDFGVRLMGLVTDQQHLAYVLRPGESEPPEGVRRLFQQSVRAAEIYAEELKPGRKGFEVKALIEERASEEGIDALIYGHTQGNWVHGLGARTVFDWPERYGSFAREPVRVGEFWSIEFRVLGTVAEWDGQQVRIPREEDAVIEADGTTRFLTGPQRQLWLIRSQ